MQVDSMDSVLGAFFPKQQLLALSLYGSGHIHRTFRVEMHGCRYLLQQFNRRVFPDYQRVADNIKVLSEYLLKQASKTGLQSLQPIPTVCGKWFFESDVGELWRAFHFIEGGVSIEKAETEESTYLAGKAYGIFATALKDFPVEYLQETITGFHDSVARWHSFETVLHKDPLNRAKDCAESIDFLRNHHPLFYEIQALRLPVRAVHNDAKIGNVLFSRTDGMILAVTDWDTVMPGYILADFGDLVRSIASPVAEDDSDISKVEVRLSFFRALCEGFLSQTGHWLQPVERAHLIDGARWIILEQGMRFLHDYLAGDVYYPTKYPGHNIDRARNQFALYRAIQAQKEAMDWIMREV